MNVAISGDAGNTYTAVTLAGIENVMISNFDTDAGSAAVDSFNASTWTGVSKVGLSASAAEGDTTFTNLANIVSAEMSSGAGDLTVNYTAAAVTGTADSQALTVNGTSAGTFNIDNGIESVAVTASGTNATLTDIVAGTNTTSMTIAAVVNLTVSNELETFTTIDASTSTGAVSVTADTTTARNLNITMGSGNDTVDIGTELTDSDTVTGGTGTDTLIVDDSSDITDLTTANKVTGFETIRLTENAGSASFANLTGYTAIDYRDVQTTTNVAEGTAVSVSADIAGTLNHGVKNATNAGTTNAVTVTIDHATANTDVDITTLTLAGIETVNLVSQGGPATTSTLAQLQAGARDDENSVGTLTATSATTVNLSGSTALDVATLTGASLVTINASGMTASTVIVNGSTSSTATVITGGTAADHITGRSGVDSISGGTGNDSIIGSGGNDTLNGDAGNDTVTGGSGNDVITGGDGNDTLNSSTGNDNVSGGAGNDTIVLATAFATDLTSSDTIAGGEGTDTLRIDDNTTVDMVTNSGALANVTGIEVISLNDNAAQTLTINDLALGINDGSSLTLKANSNQAHVINASGVLNASATINVTTDSAVTATVTYTMSNAKDNLVFGASDAAVTVANKVFMSATDTITGGTADGDVITFTDATGMTIDTTAASHALLNVTGVETLTIDSATDGAAAADYVITLGDTFVQANYDAGNDKFTIARAAGDTDGDMDIIASAVSSSYKLSLTGGAAADTITGGAGADTISGAAGADTLNGGTGADEIDGGAGADNITGGDGNDDFHVDNTTTMDTITDFNWGAATGTTTVDQFQFNANFLGNANGADTNGDFTAAAKANDGTGVVVTVSSGVAGIGATTDVAVFTGSTYANAAALDTAIEALAAGTVTQDFVAVYQDGFGVVRVAVVESDGTESGADFTVTDIAQLTGQTIGTVGSLVDIGDFIFA